MEAERIAHPTLFYIILRKIMTASYSCVMVYGVLEFPRIAMLVSDKPEERSHLCLKFHDAYMDCIICSLPSPLPNQLLTSQSTSQNMTDSSDDDGHVRAFSRQSTRNTNGQLRMALHMKRNFSVTVKHQLYIARHNIDLFLHQ